MKDNYMTKKTTKTTKAPEAPVIPQITFSATALSSAMKQVSDAQADKYHAELGKNLDARAAYEKSKNKDNAGIQRTLSAVRKSLFISRDAAKAMIACKVDADFVNSVQHEGKRYNVYAIGKFADLVKALTTGEMTNTINRCITTSMFAVIDAGKNFNMSAAKGAASDKATRELDPSIKKLLTSHTVSASTAPTQASSTMQAFQTLNVVQATGSKRNPDYKLTNNPAIKELRKAIAKPVATAAA